jgi:hypothetical protein
MGAIALKVVGNVPPGGFVVHWPMARQLAAAQKVETGVFRIWPRR